MARTLHDGWQAASSQRPGALALWDGAARRGWTFRELDDAGEAARGAPGQGPVMPAGAGAEFIIQVLAAWKDGRVVCPLEAGVAAPQAAWGELPRGVCHVKMTSGSTGAPRLVLFRGAQLAADAGHIVATMGLDRAWANVGAISLAHSYGFSNLVLPLLLHGIPLRLAGSPLPEAVRAAFPPDGGGAVALPGVPAMWRAWHAAGLAGPPVGLAISAGAPLPLELEQAVWEATGLKIHNFYGSSECGGIAYDRTAAPREDAALIGAPMEGVGLDTDAAGLLRVASPAVAEAVWPEDAAVGGWCFRTADVAEFLPSGEVRLLGRAGDVINIAGRKLHPAAIEAAIAPHPAVAECLALGLPSAQPGRGEDVACLVRLRPGGALEAVRAAALAALPAWQAPRVWLEAPGLAADGRGKVSRHAWRERVLGGDPALRTLPPQG